VTARHYVVKVADVAEDSWDDPVHGTVAWRTLFSGDRMSSAALTGGIATLEPGKALHLHRHAPHEIYMVLEGEGIVSVDGVETQVSRDSAVFIPGNARHGIRNTGTTVLRFFYSLAADSFADIAYDFG
jgi:mannose-6-phosphate isomerase-like protein (cupin superfamily)